MVCSSGLPPSSRPWTAWPRAIHARDSSSSVQFPLARILSTPHGRNFARQGVHLRLFCRRDAQRRVEIGAKLSGRKDQLLDPDSLYGKVNTAESNGRDNDGGEEEDSGGSLLQEKFGGDRIRRYWLNDHTGVLRVEEIDSSSVDGGKTSKSRGKESTRMRIPKAVLDFVLPAGFPDSVSDDYSNYMLWQFPTNVTAWICSTLVTSSLFKAVGIGGEPGYAAAATATIKWVTKDGLGAVGLLFIGGRFGSIFDEDPKQWRMYADFIGSAGSIFELCTPLAPNQFLILASLGHLTKAVAKGLKDPSFRVIQNHFAINENVGDVSAKEEVWEVAAELVGLVFGVLLLEEVWEVAAKLIGLSFAVVLLGMPGFSNSYWKLVLAWASIRSLHLFLRYQSLAVLRLPTINYKRASVLIKAYLQEYPLPGCKECNQKEELLIPWQSMSPRIWIGCSLRDILEGSGSTGEVENLMKLYAKEDYVLVIYSTSTHGVEARVLLKEAASSISILRSLWQAYWLLLPSVAESRRCEGQHGAGDLFPNPDGGESSIMQQTVKLTNSLDAMHHHFDIFVSELEAAGWDLDKIVIKVPGDAPVLIP